MHPLTIAEIERIRDTVRAVDPDDDDLLLGMIEGSTEAGELLDELLEMEATAEAHVQANKTRIAQLQERNARLARKQDAARSGMLKLLDAAGLRKMERAEATVSIRAVPPKVLGEDVTDLPEDCVQVVYKPDKKAIKAKLEAGVALPGWSMSNGGETISVRRS